MLGVKPQISQRSANEEKWTKINVKRLELGKKSMREESGKVLALRYVHSLVRFFGGTKENADPC